MLPVDAVVVEDGPVANRPMPWRVLPKGWRTGAGPHGSPCGPAGRPGPL